MKLDPLLIASFVVAIAFDVIFPLVVGYIIHHRYQVSWRFFLYGALVFLLSQLLTRVPLTQIIQFVFRGALQSSPTLQFTWLVILAITAGLFEEVGRYLGYRFLVKDSKTWKVGLMFGAGHGGLEAIVLVGGLAILSLINVISLSTTDFSKLPLSPEQLQEIQLAQQQIAALAWWTPLLGAYERFIAIFFHIALSILVLQVFLRQSWLWLVLAIALHAVVDFATVILAQQIGAVGTEGALTILLPLSLFIIYYFRPNNEPQAVGAT